MIPGSQRDIMILPYRYCHHQLAAPSVPVFIRGHDVMSNGKSVRCVIMDRILVVSRITMVFPPSQGLFAIHQQEDFNVEASIVPKYKCIFIYIYYM